jgi:hypothetical protein
MRVVTLLLRDFAADAPAFCCVVLIAPPNGLPATSRHAAAAARRRLIMLPLPSRRQVLFLLTAQDERSTVLQASGTRALIMVALPQMFVVRGADGRRRGKRGTDCHRRR